MDVRDKGEIGWEFLNEPLSEGDTDAVGMEEFVLNGNFTEKRLDLERKSEEELSGRWMFQVDHTKESWEKDLDVLGVEPIDEIGKRECYRGCGILIIIECVQPHVREERIIDKEKKII